MKAARLLLCMAALPLPAWADGLSATAQVLSPSASAAPAALSPSADVFQGSMVRVRARSLPPQPSERSLSGTEARQMPGAAGDVIRAVGTLPGSVSPNDYLSNLMVRGAGIEDNLILLDGLPVAYPFHFGGLESVFHAGLISQALFLPGGFDARFGDTLGGVLDLHTRRPEDGLHGEAGLSLIQAQGLVSLARGSAGWSAVADWRQGDLQWVLPSSTTSVGLPQWMDWSAGLRGPLGGGTLRLLGYGASDSLVVHVPGSPDSRWDSDFQSMGAVWQRNAGAWNLELRGWSTRDSQSVFINPTQHLTMQPDSLGFLAEGGTLVSGQHGLDGGVQWQRTVTQLQGNFFVLPAELGSDLNINALAQTTITASGSKAVASLWLQDRWQMLPNAAMTVGGRYDHVDITGEFHFSPRWALSVDAWDGGTLSAAFGDYFESPEPMETVAGWNSGDLGSTLVRSYSTGLEQRWQGWDLKLEVYRRNFQRDVPPQVLTSTAATGDVALNAFDTGWAEGAEALLKMPQLGPLSGWASYAWSDVMHVALSSTGQTMGYYPADFSQPHVGSLVLQCALPWGMQLGGRLRLATGIPYTPIASRTPNGSGGYTPTFGPTNSARLPDYQRLDLRLQKRWAADEGAWWHDVTAYLEVFNATNADNITSVSYKSDYSDIERIRQFPRLPILGVDLAF
jgi:hypothetical protein